MTGQPHKPSEGEDGAGQRASMRARTAPAKHATGAAGRWIPRALAATVVPVALLVSCTQWLTEDGLRGGGAGSGGSVSDAADTGYEGAAAQAGDATVEDVDAGKEGSAEAGSDGDALSDGAACMPGWADCDGIPANGCETDIASDALSCGGCGHDCLGGDCTDGVCQPVVIATGLGSPSGLVVDVGGLEGRVYWTSRVDDGQVGSVAKTGGEVAVHATAQPMPSGITADGERIYWVNAGVTDFGGSVASVQKSLDPDGGGVAVLATDQGSPFTVVHRDGRLFWTNALNADGAVMMVDTDGTNPTELAGNQDRPMGIAVDETGVFWVVMDDGLIMRCELDHQPPKVTEYLSGLSSPVGIALDLLHVYWTEATGAVMRVSKVGKTPEAIATGQGLPAGIAVDGTHVYWVDNLYGRVVRKSKAGGDVEDIATGQQGPIIVAVDEVAVYWTNSTGGTVAKRAK